MSRRLRLRRVGRASLAAALLAAAPPGALGSGLETNGIGARGRAMGYALVAAADDWSAVHYNPANLTRAGRSHEACVYEYFRGSSDATESLRNLPPAEGPDPSRGDFVDLVGDEPRSFGQKEVSAEVHAGEAGYAGRLGPLAVGLGLYGSGAGSRWDDDVTTASGDEVDARVSYTNAAVNLPLAVAYEAAPGVSVGAAAGLRLGVLDAEVSKKRSGGVPYRLSSELETRGFGVGLDLGVSWAPAPGLVLGAVARLPYTLRKKGRIEVRNTLAPPPYDSLESDTEVHEDIPLRLAAGLAWRAGPSDLVALSATWHQWSDYERRTEYDDEVPGVLEDSSGNPARWTDTWVVNLGYERRLGEGWDLRAGVAFDQAPEPPEYRTLVGGQVVDTWKFALGGGRLWDRGSLDFGYTVSWAPRVDGYVPGARYGLLLQEFYLGVVWGRGGRPPAGQGEGERDR